MRAIIVLTTSCIQKKRAPVALFGVIVGKDNIERLKPHPDTYLVAADKLRVEPARCLAIEDAEKGIRSAREAGMRVILVETPITRDLELDGADLALSNLAELRDLLEEIAARGKR